MPQPTPYSPSVDFSNEEANNVGGRSTVRTAPLDAELSAIAATLQGVLANLALNQRDDGEIRDQRVKLHTLSQDVRALLVTGNVTAENVRGAWVTAAVYVKLDLVSQGGNTYICAVAHTAGTFATDLAAGRWLLVALGAATAASAVPFTATATIAATNVQAAIEEADTENRALNALLRSDLADKVSASKGAGIVGFNPSLNYVAQTIGLMGKAFGRATDFMTDAQIVALNARTYSTDMAAAVQQVHDLYDVVWYPQGGYRFNSSLTINRGSHAMGAGLLSVDVYFYGCDGYVIQGANSSGITISGMAIRSVSSGGAADPKTNDGVSVLGTSAENVNYLTLRDLFLQGWNRCIDGRYLWNSTLDNVTTLNCTTSVRLFGLSVNNSISSCRLGGAATAACIDLVADGSTKGEGLSISDTLIAEGAFGVRATNGWLSLNLSNCIVDLITDTGLQLTDARKTAIVGGWIFAAKKGVDCLALGTAEEVNVSLSGVHVITTDAVSRCIDFNGNNMGLTVTGGSLTTGSSGYCVYADGSGVSVTGVRLVNPSSNPSILFGSGTGYQEAGNTGNVTVSYTAGVPSAFRGRLVTYRTGLVYGTTLNIDASRGNYFNVVATNGTAFTIAAPTNPPTDPQSQIITLTIANASGGALGTVTWNAVFKLASWTSPATGFSRSITFEWNGTSWVEISRTPADVPN